MKKYKNHVLLWNSKDLKFYNTEYTYLEDSNEKILNFNIEDIDIRGEIFCTVNKKKYIYFGKSHLSIWSKGIVKECKVDSTLFSNICYINFDDMIAYRNVNQIVAFTFNNENFKFINKGKKELKDFLREVRIIKIKEELVC